MIKYVRLYTFKNIIANLETNHNLFIDTHETMTSSTWFTKKNCSQGPRLLLSRFGWTWFFWQTSLPCESVSMIAVCQTWWYMSMIVYGKIVVYSNLNHLSGYHHFPEQPEMGSRAPLSAKVQCSVPFIACSRSIRWGHDILVRYSNF